MEERLKHPYTPTVAGWKELRQIALFMAVAGLVVGAIGSLVGWSGPG